MQSNTGNRRRKQINSERIANKHMSAVKPLLCIDRGKQCAAAIAEIPVQQEA